MGLFTITAEAILAIALNSGNTPQSNGSYFNYNAEDGKVTWMTICKDDGCGGLVYDTRYDYKYDGQDRLVSKTVYTWDSDHGRWKPTDVYRYDYDFDHTTVEYAQWNKRSADFTDLQAKFVYTSTAPDSMCVACYNWDRKHGYTEQYQVNTGNVDLLLARNIMNVK